MAGPSPKPKFKAEEPVFSTENIRLYLDPSNAETLSQQLKKEGYVVIFRTFLTDSGLKNVLIANKQGVTEDQLIEILNKVGVILPSPSKQVVPQKTPQQAAKEQEQKKKAEEEAKKKAEEEAKKKAQEEAKKKAAEEQKKKAEEEAKRKAEEEAKKKAEEEAKKKEPQKPAPKEAPQEKPQEPSKLATIPDLTKQDWLPKNKFGTTRADEKKPSTLPNLDNFEISGEKKGETGKILEHESKIIRIKEYKGKPALYMWGSITTGSSNEDKVIYSDREKLKGDEKNVVPIQEDIKGKSILHGYLVFGINYLRANSNENGYLTPDAKKQILDEIRDHIGINPDRLKEIEKYILDKIHVNK